jgi:uncharacterized protein (TIGR00369 family)
VTDTQVSGLDFVRSLRDSEPIRLLTLLGFELTEVDEGRVVFELTPTTDVYNPLGSVHGGVLATLCDSAMGCAVNTTLPPGVDYSTLEMKVNFLRRVTADSGVVRCEGTVLMSGTRTALATASAFDPEGRLVAHGTSTCLVLRP